MIKAIAFSATLMLPALGTGAKADPVTFEADGVRWTIIDGGSGAPISAVHMPPGFASLCPSHTVRLVHATADEGPPMTQEQTFRADER